MAYYLRQAEKLEKIIDRLFEESGAPDYAFDKIEAAASSVVNGEMEYDTALATVKGDFPEKAA